MRFGFAKKYVQRLVIITLISLANSCSQFLPNITDPTNSENNDVKVLFIGSSYFSFNDLPQLVKKLIKEEGKDVFIDSRIINGKFLDFHAGDVTTESKINQQPWDYVILQGVCINAGYPETHQRIFPPYERHPLKSSLETLKQKILANNVNTEIIYCMPWAFEDGTTWIAGQNDTYEDMQKKIYDNVIELARELDIIISPVGWAWYEVLKDTQWLHYLHLSDYNHPSLSGSYLMARTIYVTLYQERLEDVNYYGGLHEDDALYFQTVASQTVMNDLILWNLGTDN